MKVCVIGAGVIGLSSTLRILERFPWISITIFAEEFSPNTTGDGAVGLWLPYTLGDTPVKDCLKWASSTFDYLVSLSQHEDAQKIGVELISGYNFFLQKKEPPFWKDVCFGFRRVTQRELDLLAPQAKVKRKGCLVVKRKIEDLEKLAGSFDVIVNCTGLGSYCLVNDKSISPYQGHLVTVENVHQNMFWINSFDDDHTAIHPRGGVIIVGGTKYMDEWGTETSPEIQEGILKRAHKLMPSLKNGIVVESWTGLRPVRSKGVRLERELKIFGSRKVHVVHNYGHGGGGITLHWGCAGEVATLVGQCIGDLPCSKL